MAKGRRRRAGRDLLGRGRHPCQRPKESPRTADVPGVARHHPQGVPMRRSFIHAAGLAVLALSFAAPASADLKPTKRVEPQYPVEAARAGTQGFVEVEFVVDEGG